ncbi:MAG: hypothetical protein LBU91_00670 [Bacteroidales bacterium]|jgi:DNA mismatch repair ATPase MutS|nr:hypothetical protein [Bacteroidales bacterium]
MAYTTDKQTDYDLNLSGRFKSSSIFNLFEQTATRGGSLLLEKIFATPLTSAAEIIARRDILMALQDYEGEFEVNNDEMKQTADYLNSSDYANIAMSFGMMWWKKMQSTFMANPEFQTIIDGLAATHRFLNHAELFLLKVEAALPDSKFLDKIKAGLAFLSDAQILRFRQARLEPVSLWQISGYNRMLRKIYSYELRHLIELIEELDCYMSIARTGKEKGFTYAEVLDSTDTYIELDNVRHPRVPGAVGNSFKFTHDSNVIFLTGANMAGKSTFMKSFGIALYLAHLGFPVPADKMVFTPMEGMFTSINVPDDISQGYSHFYAEVMRVKSIAKEVASGKRLIVIFDELFKGTNVKDAYDGTVAITEAFSKRDKCVFIVSTHIMEAGVTLKEQSQNIQFSYLPTIVVDDRPTYTYKLTEGIADDRHGMRIINNERIIEIIRGEA